MNRIFNLQLFAEDGSGAAGAEGGQAGTPSTTPESADGNQASGSEAKPETSFDDFLKNGGQAEFDRRVEKAIRTAVNNAKGKWEAVTDDKLSEAEKLSKMTAEEKATYRAEKAEKELNELKHQMAIRDMVKTARGLLAEEKISVPDEIIKNLVTEDAETTKTAVKDFADAFKQAVQDAVKDALRGKTPRASTGSTKPITREQILAVKDRAERQRLIAEHADLFPMK